ncbi:hypothetical protein [Mycolicibacter icosiumassiliensis]|uniref:hypothetical protein n=1 Tax=Mycolicibacter icosiumassiliensis TaxID=1792835 RepID=UPI0008345E4B|nr:hypothetical protein [Mycolicibacter icosiumassiliensis]
MIALVIAVIGLVGTVAAGSAVSEWLARRSLPEKIKGDLAVWSELPDSETKARLLTRIEQRVERLGVEGPSRWRVLALVFFPTTVVTFVVFDAVIIINGGFSFRRGEDGILRWHMPNGDSYSFIEFMVRHFFLYAFMVIVAFVTREGLEYRRWRRAQRLLKQVDYAPRHSAETASPNGETETRSCDTPGHSRAG